jgi:hypothetical protein
LLRTNLNKIALLFCALALVSFTVIRVHAGYTFKVHNKTENKIVKLMASEDGETYGNFDIGDGIDSGETSTLEWDKSTDDGNCEWYFKARLDDGEETEPVEFDFCEKNLVLEIK